MNTYTIYADRLEEVEKRLRRLGKKASRYDIPLSWEIGARHMEHVHTMKADPVTGTIGVSGGYDVEAVDISVDLEALIMADGWKVEARLEHGEGGNIVNLFGNASREEMEDWRQRAGHCDHCHSNRQRKVTYMVRSEDEGLRQVGSTCLKEYTGIDERGAVLFAEVREALEEDFRDFGTGYHAEPVYDVKEALTGAVNAIRKHGYVRSSDPDSTKEAVHKHLVFMATDITNADREEADRVYHWLIDEYHNADSIEANAVTLAECGYCKAGHLGYIAYAPVAYSKAMQRAKINAERAEQAKSSEYIGEAGSRLTIALNACKLVTSWENRYGMTFLYKMEDINGNVLVWFASSPALDDGAGVKAITGTVKAHNIRDGVKQTVLTRCKRA